MTPAGRRDPGSTVTLELVPFESKPELASEQGFDDFDEDVEKMLAPRFWAAAELVPEENADGSDPTRARLIASTACLLATILVIVIASRLRSRPGWAVSPET